MDVHYEYQMCSHTAQKRHTKMEYFASIRMERDQMIYLDHLEYNELFEMILNSGHGCNYCLSVS